ncbi:unnamed protein product [Gulo gulo]|uniref:Uncharacterized protein n=1 Tax=Gulo gulo TaxID=48420 RepID=A0A9X9LEW8_GULGU|nr:unnamed protein product [Gulo gulo]
MHREPLLARCSALVCQGSVAGRLLRRALRRPWPSPGAAISDLSPSARLPVGWEAACSPPLDAACRAAGLLPRGSL